MAKEIKKPEKSVGKQPLENIRAGAFKVAIWNNEGEKDGKEYSFYTATLQRGYTDKAGQWQNQSISLRRSDIPNAILVLQKAYDKMSTKEVGNSEDEEE